MMKRWLHSVEALATAFEEAGCIELATSCDQAAFWLCGDSQIASMSIMDVEQMCRETLGKVFDVDGTEKFVHETVDEIRQNVEDIKASLESSTGIEDLLDKAAKIQAIAIMTREVLRSE